MIRVEHTKTAPPSRWTLFFRIGAALIVILSIATAGFAAWALIIPEPMPQAISALESGPEVTVTQQEWIVFSPTFIEPTAGFIFYPGGRVDARAYAPAARELARAGILVIITPMPLNLAFFAPNNAKAVINAYPQIAEWYVGGHSLGGAMAASFIYNQPDCCAGLILWASYPAENNDLSAVENLQVASIYGTLDGLATPEKVLNGQPLLPPAARFVPIAGGNHAQFGWYGPQSGDNEATLSREEQQSRVVQATLELIMSPRQSTP